MGPRRWSPARPWVPRRPKRRGTAPTLQPGWSPEMWARSNPTVEKEERKKGKWNHSGKFRAGSGPAEPTSVEHRGNHWVCRQLHRMASEAQKIQWGPGLQGGGWWLGNHHHAWNWLDIHPISFCTGLAGGGASRRWQAFYRWHASCHLQQYLVHPFGSLTATSIVAGLGEVVEWWQAKGIRRVKTLKRVGQLVKAPSGFTDANVGWFAGSGSWQK